MVHFAASYVSFFLGCSITVFCCQVQEASNRTMALEAEVKREADFNASLEEMILGFKWGGRYEMTKMPGSVG